MTGLDTLMDTLEEGRHSFLDFSTFPDLLKSSNPPLSANQSLEISTFRGSLILLMRHFCQIFHRRHRKILFDE